MAAVTITASDLAPFADIEEVKAQEMIADALARAARVAPCIRDETLDDDLAAAAKAILRDAVLRRNEAGAGMVTQQSAGPFSQTVDTRPTSRVLLWPSEVDELKAICRDHNGEKGGAYSVDMTSSVLTMHADWCATNLGGDYCDCGASIAGYPLFYEGT